MSEEDDVISFKRIMIFTLSGSLLGPLALSLCVVGSRVLHEMVSIPRAYWDVSPFTLAYYYFFEVVLFNIGFWCVWGLFFGGVIGFLSAIFLKFPARSKQEGLK